MDQNEGPGLQHIVIKTNIIFETITKMRRAEEDYGGFELMVRPSDGYYQELPSRLGDRLSAEQYKRLEELGVLADADKEGVLLQIFTKPLGDRPTLLILFPHNATGVKGLIQSYRLPRKRQRAGRPHRH